MIPVIRPVVFRFGALVFFTAVPSFPEADNTPFSDYYCKPLLSKRKEFFGRVTDFFADAGYEPQWPGQNPKKCKQTVPPEAPQRPQNLRQETEKQNGTAQYAQHHIDAQFAVAKGHHIVKAGYDYRCAVEQIRGP